MKKIAKSLIGKMSSAVLVDGKCLNAGFESQEQWTTYVLSQDEEQTKELFYKDEAQVLLGTANEVLISSSWAKAVCFIPKDYIEFQYFCNRATEFQGIVVYSYDNLFDCSDEKAMKKHFDICTEIIGIINMNVVMENGKKYLVGYRTHKNLLTFENFDKFKAMFYSPVIDTSITKLKFNGLRTQWSHPNEFQEKEVPDWKTEYLFKQQTITEGFFSDTVKPKFTGGTVELPNHEQLAILLASGAIDREVELADGRIVVLKGTEIISTKERIKRDLEGNAAALVRQQVRNTVLYELDLTNGIFSELSDVEDEND